MTIRRVAVFVTLLAANHAGAQAPPNSIWEASGGLLPDEACPQWVLQDESISDPTLAAGALTLSTETGNSELMFYTQADADILVSFPIVIEFRMRYVSGSSASPAREGAIVGFDYQAFTGNNFNVAADEIFLLANDTTRGPAAVVDTDGDFHTYRIEVGSDGTTQVFYDGSLTLTGTSFVDTGNRAAFPRIFWGDGTRAAGATTEWQLMQHNIGSTPCTSPVATGSTTWGRLKQTYRSQQD